MTDLRRSPEKESVGHRMPGDRTTIEAFARLSISDANETDDFGSEICL